MSAFEVVSWPMLGLGVGFFLAALVPGRAIRMVESLVLGAVGGLVGGIAGHDIFTAGPVWGELKYSPYSAAAAVVAAGLFVIGWRLSRPRARPRPRAS